MQRRRATLLAGLILVAGLAACGGPPSVAPANRTPTASATITPATTPGPVTRVPMGTPSPPAEWVDVAIPIFVAFAGQPVAMDATSSETGGPTNLLLASTTIDFGDGTRATAPGSCRSLVRFSHRYSRPGDYRPRVTAATSCDPSVSAHLSEPLQTVHVLTAASATSATWPRCSPVDLRMEGFPAGVGLGNVAARVTLTNVGERHCILEGYPRVVLVGRDGRLLSTQARPATTGAYLFAAVMPDRVALVPGGAASFMLGYTDNPFGPDATKPYDVACPPSSAVRVILPGGHAYGTARIAIAVCGGLLEVSPIVPGADGLRPGY